jgi:hypothetical protein
MRGPGLSVGDGGKRGMGSACQRLGSAFFFLLCSFARLGLGWRRTAAASPGSATGGRGGGGELQRGTAGNGGARRRGAAALGGGT